MAITRASLEDNLIDSGYQIAGSKASAEEAWGEIQKIEDVDVVLLDIHLAGEKNGIWLAQQIRKNLRLPIVYLTAFGDDRTLQEIVETKPNGYLMKPYNVPTLLTTITIAIQSYANELNKDDRLEAESFNLKDTIYIKDSHIRVKLKINEIIYIQSDGNYLNVYLKNKRHVIRSKMDDFLIKLDSSIFQRIHQRYAVNISKIDQIGADHLAINNVDIPLRGKYKVSLLERLNIN